MAVSKSNKSHDTHCRKPLCIRNITRQQQTGDYRFEVEWHTSAGIIKSVGWRWLRAHNRLLAPMCNGHHIFKLQPNVRAAIRNLFTRIMSDRSITIPPIYANRTHALTKTENLLGSSHASPQSDHVDPELFWLTGDPVRDHQAGGG